jgi:hypothetical protein
MKLVSQKDQEEGYMLKVLLYLTMLVGSAIYLCNDIDEGVMSSWYWWISRSILCGKFRAGQSCR